MMKIYKHDQNKVFINKEQRYLKGNIHTHSHKSDGMYTIEELLEIYEKKDYDFLAITDHDVFCDENIKKDIVLIHGIEVSCLYIGKDKTKGEFTHFCCFGPYNKRKSSIYRYSNYLELQENIKKLKEEYSLIQLSHPLFSGLLSGEWIEIEGYHLIEIYNHDDFLEETGMQNSEQLIRELLNHHKKLLVTAVDDFHGPYQKVKNDKCFGGYIMVNANKKEKDIVQAIKEGKFYATTGPQILDYRIEKGTLKIETSPVKRIIFYSNMRKCKNIFHEDGSEITIGEYQLKGEEFYIWTKVIDKYGNIAWTQPIYLEQNDCNDKQT